MTIEGEMITAAGELADLQTNGKFDIEKVQNFTLKTRPTGGILDERLSRVPGEEGAGYLTKTVVSGMCVAYASLQLNQRSLLVFKSTQPVVQMFFALHYRGRHGLREDAGTQVPFEEPAHNLYLFQPGSIVSELPAYAQAEVFSVSLSVETFMDLLPEADAVKDRFLRYLKGQVSGCLRREHFPLTPKMTAIVHEIIGNKYGCNIKALFLKAKIMELLALQLEQSVESAQRNTEGLLKKEDLEKIYLAREIMLEDLSREFTLKGLARRVGTNEFNLKKHFKQVYGKTVFGYLHEYKMERSKILITEGGEKIGDVAIQMGYRYPSHFTAAFRKYFGVLPKQLRHQVFLLGGMIAKLEEAVWMLMETARPEALL